MSAIGFWRSTGAWRSLRDAAARSRRETGHESRAREAYANVHWRKQSRDRGYSNTHRVPLARLVVPPPPNHQRDAPVVDRLDDRRESVEYALDSRLAAG